MRLKDFEGVSDTCLLICICISFISFQNIMCAISNLHCFTIYLVTYYPDRPDVMATFKQVRIEADKKKFPVLLSNGNLLEEGDCENGRHFAVWHGGSCSFILCALKLVCHDFMFQISQTELPSFIVQIPIPNHLIYLP